MNTLETVYPAYLAKRGRPLPTPDAEALEALTFARAHDWGRQARLRVCSRGKWYITDLQDCYTIRGTWHMDYAAVPATIAELRKFGHY